ncbi:MAG: EAL domain-containing protein [Gemmatimonadota bacterium]
MCRGLALALLLLTGLLPTAAAAQRMQFRHLGMDEGLPSSLVSDILQDCRGFMWIGTAHGVSRYDGHRFRTYGASSDSAHALPVGLVDHLYEDHTSTLWAVTVAGLSRYDGRIDGFVTYPADSITRDVTAELRARAEATADSSARGDAMRAHPQVTAVLQDHRGRLLVGTTVGLYLLDRRTGRSTFLPLTAGRNGPVRHAVAAIFEDRSKRLWVGTRQGLFRIGDSTQATKVWDETPGALGHLADPYVRALAQDSSGGIWVGTRNGGVARIDQRTDRLTTFKHRIDNPGSLAGNRITRLLADRTRGGVWIGVENAGVDYFDPRSGTFVHHRHDPNDPMSIRSNSIWALYQDAGGLLWVGTFSGGLDVTMRNSAAIQLFQSVPGNASSLSFNAVPGFGEDRAHRIWVVTDGGGVNLFDPLTGLFEHFTTLNSRLGADAVLSVAQERDGTAWFATWGGGLNRFDARTRSFSAFTTDNSDIPHDNLYEVMVTRAGEVWVGTDNGVVAQLDRARGRFGRRFRVTPKDFDPASVLMMRELADGRFAVGLRDGGLVILDPRTGDLDAFSASTDSTRGIASNEVRTVHEGRDGALWVGTDEGLDRLDLRRRRREHFGTAHGLPSAYIDGILDDGAGQLWISTDHGLSRLDPARKTFRTLTRLDGLQGNEFLMRSAFRGSDGTLYFGGNQGFNAIRPDRLVENTRPPRIVFTNLLIFNRTVTPRSADSPLRQVLHETSELTLDHSQNVLTFEFAALDFSAPEKTRYAYRLIGFDSEWQHVGEQHTASYTNLAPGHYTLRVKASNGDGVWNETGNSLSLTITPPVWGTWWFQLSVAVIVLLAILRLWRFQQQRRLEIALSQQALQDPLTGLSNRLLFRDRVETALLRLQRERVGGNRSAVTLAEDPQVAVLFLDLDNFKTVNDSLGHHAGDQLLRIVSSRLLNATRGSDTVARFGGDEFAVLLENMRSAEDAYVVADRITSSLRAPVPVGTTGQPREARVGVSIGIAFADMPLDATELLRNADAAMYRAKREGKGRYMVFDPQLVAAAEEQLDLEHGIALAQERGEMAVVYQPIVDLASGHVTGAEALLRWTHPTRGAISPARFIPLAESSGVILELGQWALHTACRAAASWPAREDGQAAGVSVNVSWRQLLHPMLLADVEAALASTGLASARLTLEITESVLMQDTVAALRVLHSLKAFGVRLAVDDFGTGYSSLRYLQQFPIDMLKIDKSFVDNVAGGVQDAALARMIIGLGESLGLDLVAEGVEHASQRDLLLTMGCVFGQGYLFAQPLSDAEVSQVLAEHRPLFTPVDGDVPLRSDALELIAPA